MNQSRSIVSDKTTFSWILQLCGQKLTEVKSCANKQPQPKFEQSFDKSLNHGNALSYMNKNNTKIIFRKQQE